MQAANFEQALNNFSSSELLFTPNSSPCQSKEFYVDRDENPFGKLKALLRSSNAFNKVLFTGHMGCGKSTELNRLVADEEISERFFVVKYSIFEVLDILDITYIDLLVSIGAMVFKKAIHKRLRIAPDLLNRLESWKKTITERISIDEGTAGAGVEARLDAFFLNLTTRLKMEHTTRQIVREIIEPRVSEMIDIINRIIDGTRLSLPPDKDLLIIIDDLEKIPDIEKAKTLYHDTGLLLTKPNCKIIYTVPIALHYSVEFKQIAANFGITCFFPNIRLCHRDRAKDENGLKSMERFVTNRMKQSLIDDDALAEAIHNSGGIVRELGRIMGNSCLIALAKRMSTITKEIVRESVAEIRNEFGRMLTDEHYRCLDGIEKTKMVGGDKISIELLHSLSALEYLNNERWCDVNPVVLKLLEQHRKSIYTQ